MQDFLMFLGLYFMPLITFIFMSIVLEDRKVPQRFVASICFALMMWALVGAIYISIGY